MSRWSRDELMLVMNLYTKLRYGQFNYRNKDVIELAHLIDKTPGAVAFKLVHLSRQDPKHKNRVKGLANPGKNAIEMYNDFTSNWDEMLYKSEMLLFDYKRNAYGSESQIIKHDLLIDKYTGVDKERMVKTRVNQNVFRQIILNNYSSSCAVCNLNIDKLLIASHILKWSDNANERLNPENGLCLCNIHDKAFELGYLGITPDYQIKISNNLSSVSEDTYYSLFGRHKDKHIIMPDKFYPNPKFLDMHFQSTFIK